MLESSRISNYALDNFVAHKLSLLTECGAPELATELSGLNTFILNNMLNFTLDNKSRAHAFNFIRKIEGAFSVYGEARLALQKYVDSPRNTISPYFTSLLYFEICITQSYQAYELFRSFTGSDKFFKQGDGCEMDRLLELYNVSRHMNNRIDALEFPYDATSSIWITNQGLECPKARLSFVEFSGVLKLMGQAANNVSNIHS